MVLEKELESLNWEKALGRCGQVDKRLSMMMDLVESRQAVFTPLHSSKALSEANTWAYTLEIQMQ